MSFQSIGFIGGGRVARILLGGWHRAEAMPAEVVVYDPDPKALEFLEMSVGASVRTTDGPEAAASADLVVLAVHPPVVAAALETVLPVLRTEALVLSLAPKVVLSKMAEALGGFPRLARMIPNAPSIVGAGYNPVAFSKALGEAERREVFRLFEPLGECPEVEEEALEAYAVVSAMGPTYLSFQLATLRDLAVEFGLSPGAAAEATARMVHGAAATLFESGLNEAEAMDLIPVRPLAAQESVITSSYRSVLSSLYEKLAGRPVTV